MKTLLRGYFLFFAFSLTALGQTSEQTAAPSPWTSKLTLKAAIVDKDLNVKPLPKAEFTLRPVPTTPGNVELKVVTGFDGTVTTDVPFGKYRVISAQPLDLQGKRFSWDYEFTVSQPNATIELSNDNASISAVALVDDLTSSFKHYQNSVVTVLAEVGPAKGTGFIVDPTGLVLTNQHVVETSTFVAVQFDQKRVLPAVVLASDSTEDIAVLWVNLAAVPEAIAAPLLSKGEQPAEEGERVFTIGSPLHQSKVMTTGIVSKVEDRVIISDININHGNSGGPLFNSRGKVIGITTFGDISNQGGPGISGILRIEQAEPLIESARAKMTVQAKPPADFLPAAPTDTYPIDAIKANLAIEKFKTDPYIFGVGDYDVAMVTPILLHRHYESAVLAAKQKEKRNRRSEAAQGTFEPLDNLQGWREYVGDYEPVLLVEARPKLKETFWSAFGRGMAAAGGSYYAGPARMHFKTDFYKMKLLCGSEEVRPIMPGKSAIVLDEHNAAISVTDATFSGLYVYPADAINSKCGRVSLQIFSEKEPNQAKTKDLEPKTIDAVVRDFQPYFEAQKETNVSAKKP